MNLIYSCVFFQQSYINLVRLLLKSYVLYGNPKNTKYLIITCPEFKNIIQKICNDFNIDNDIWCLNLNTLFQASCCKLNIFDYKDVNKYSKILYLDCDILVTNSLSNILDLEIDNKLYVLKEECHRDFHCSEFSDEEYKLLNKDFTFSAGMFLFNNCDTIREMFKTIKTHIKTHLDNNKPKPICLDQPFVIYQAINLNLFNNTRLINIVVNNPVKFKGETISHFPGNPGHYDSKIHKMGYYLNYMKENFIVAKKGGCNELVGHIFS